MFDDNVVKSLCIVGFPTLFAWLWSKFWSPNLVSSKLLWKDIAEWVKPCWKLLGFYSINFWYVNWRGSSQIPIDQFEGWEQRGGSEYDIIELSRLWYMLIISWFSWEFNFFVVFLGETQVYKLLFISLNQLLSSVTEFQAFKFWPLVWTCVVFEPSSLIHIGKIWWKD